MSDASDLEKIIETQIHEPAIQELHELYDQGLINRTDVDRFRVSVRQYKAVLLSQHAGLDASVRHELLKSLLTDYKATIDSIVRNIAKRGRPQAAAVREEQETSRIAHRRDKQENAIARPAEQSAEKQKL